MTKQDAKDLSLEVWRYLAEHPEIQNKCDLPDGIYNKIQYMKFKCPLCEVLGERCDLCPLVSCIKPSHFVRWFRARSNKGRKKAAREIVRMIEAWEPEEI